MAILDFLLIASGINFCRDLPFNLPADINEWKILLDSGQIPEGTKFLDYLKMKRNATISPPTGPTDQEKIISSFGKSLVDRTALDRAVTREQFIRQLIAQYPQIDEGSIADYVYGTYPDNYEKTGSAQGIDYYVRQIKNGAIDIANVPADIRSAVADRL